MKNSDEEVERILGVKGYSEENEYINNEVIGGKEGQIRFKDESRVMPGKEQVGGAIENSKPFETAQTGCFSLEEILGLQMNSETGVSGGEYPLESKPFQNLQKRSGELDQKYSHHNHVDVKQNNNLDQRYNDPRYVDMQRNGDANLINSEANRINSEAKLKNEIEHRLFQQEMKRSNEDLKRSNAQAYEFFEYSQNSNLSSNQPTLPNISAMSISNSNFISNSSPNSYGSTKPVYQNKSEYNSDSRESKGSNFHLDDFFAPSNVQINRRNEFNFENQLLNDEILIKKSEYSNMQNTGIESNLKSQSGAESSLYGKVTANYPSRDIYSSPISFDTARNDYHLTVEKPIDRRFDKPMTFSDMKNSNQRESNLNPMLFRNPVFFQSSFNPNAYNRVKRRRRLNSNTCNYTSNSSFHPSKLSSIDYVLGNLNNEAKSPFSESPHNKSDLNRNLEAFRSKITGIDFDNVTVLELKTLLKDFGVNPSGKKQEMIDRLQLKLKELGESDKAKATPLVKPKEHSSFDGFFF